MKAREYNIERIVYVAGAASRARTAKEYIEFLYPTAKVTAFLVSPEMEIKTSCIAKTPVIALDKQQIDNRKLDITAPVFIATKNIYWDKLEEELSDCGFTNIHPMDVQLDTYLRIEYIKVKYYEMGKRFQLIDDLNSNGARKATIEGRIYVASASTDKSLQEKYLYGKEEESIHLGAELIQDNNEPGLKDNLGKATENISELNGQFCELTGLYWIWKHATEDYIGLVHYRRHFILPTNWIDICDANNIDVILPVPLYVGPSLAADYKRRHVAKDWDILMEYLQSHFPDEYWDMRKFFEGNFYNPCNMLIARKSIIDDYCKWLFPIVFTIYKNIGDRKDSYQRRYPGFMAERLMSYYFDKNKDRLKIVYANKNFLS